MRNTTWLALIRTIPQWCLFPYAVHTEYGALQLTIPRDRNGEFKQQTIAPYRRSNDTLESFVIRFFPKGVTMIEISDLIEKMYGHYYTPQTVSKMAKVMTGQFEALIRRPLSARDMSACIWMRPILPSSLKPYRKRRATWLSAFKRTAQKKYSRAPSRQSSLPLSEKSCFLT